MRALRFWRDGFQGLGQRWLRRWVWAAVGGVAGLLLSQLGTSDVAEQHAQLSQAVAALSTQAEAVKPSAAAVAVGVGVEESDVASLPGTSAPANALWLEQLPSLNPSAPLWTALQQGLTQQGLQVLSLRPLAWSPGVPLGSQAVAVRLQGQFGDWQQAWLALAQAGPVWSLDSLTLSASSLPGQVQLEGVLRVWAHPGAGGRKAWPAGWDHLGPSAAASKVNPFALAFSAAMGGDSTGTVAASMQGTAQGINPGTAQESGELKPADAAMPLPADPRQWPLARIRLLGIWQQGQQTQAVLGAGPHWVALGPGAVLAQEAYLVQAIHADAVVLQSVTGPAVRQVLSLNARWNGGRR